jgi:hypothetical protein
MERDSRSGRQGKGSLEELMRERIRGSIELIVEQELGEALGAAGSERVGWPTDCFGRAVRAPLETRGRRYPRACRHGYQTWTPSVHVQWDR